MYQTATVALSPFNSKEQLGSNAIKGIIEDEMSNVWVGTGNGLCCINSQTGSIDRYTTADGLPINQFNYSSACKKPDGNCISELSTV
jgi:ligand-binding sensor domain-containing protein